jgi:hypothetical protein
MGQKSDVDCRSRIHLLTHCSEDANFEGAPRLLVEILSGPSVERR